MSESVYHGNPVSRLRALARFARGEGLLSKGEMLDALADDMDLYEPVVRAIEEAYEEGELDREEVEERVKELERKP